MSELAQVLRPLLPVDDPHALVDASTGDDAAVYDLGDGRALVVTLDFFTPMVDDPFDFGRIAGANSLSDVWAMGARPLFVLNLLGFPRALLGEGLVEEIMRGGAEITAEVGVPILGGHTVDDPEPKYGMVAVGEAPTDRIVTNTGARPGDRLVLTKPLGTGIISTAIKAGTAPEAVVAEAVETMTWLNEGAAEVMVAHGIRAATDVTGYGLLGHLGNVLRRSGVGAEIDAASVPILNGARELFEAGHVPGGTGRNLNDVTDTVDFGEVDESTRVLLADAQTSGGLLMCVPEDRLDAVLADLEGTTKARAVIGRVTESDAGRIAVV